MNIKKNKMIKNLIIIFMIFLLLINFIITGCVFAVQVSGDRLEYFRMLGFQKALDCSEESLNIDIGEETSEYKQINHDIENYYYSFNNTFQSFDNYAESNKDKFDMSSYGIGAYKNKYNYTSSGGGAGYSKAVISPIYTAYLNEKYQAYIRAYPTAFSKEDMKNLQEKINKADEEDDINLSKSNLTEEEIKKSETLLKDKDNGNILEEIFADLLSGLINFVAGLGDVVICTTQDFMLTGAPTAVAKRTNTETMHQLLNERGDDSFVIAFSKGAGSSATYERSDVPVPFIYYSPAAIFSNKIPALDINFFDENSQIKSPYVVDDNNQISAETIKKSKEMLKATNLTSSHARLSATEIEDLIDELANNPTEGNVANALQTVVSKWYVALRNLTILGQLVILVYIGIRILISASAEETAKYKKMILNWVLGIILVFVIHYLMMILLTLVQSLINMFGNVINIQGDTLMNKARIEVVHYGRIEDLPRQFGYAIIYLVMVWYVIMFTWQYLKRVIYMAFLTIIAPMVALTYPLDKVKDGQSQAFNMWLKEYIFNLLLQPIHLLLYIIFVNSAIELAEINFLYSAVAIGFIVQAEGFMKKLFNINARGGSAKESIATGAAFSTMIKQTQNFSKKITAGVNGTGSGNSSGGSTGSGSSESGVRTANQNIPKLFNIPNQQIQNQQIQSNQIKNSLGNISYNPGKFKSRIKKSSGIKNINIKGKKFNGSLPQMGNSKIIHNPTDINLTLNNSRDTNNMQQTQEINNRKPVPSRIINGVRLVHGRYKGNGKKLAKIVTKTMGAGAFGMMGIAAGLASDDFSNVLKLGALGVGTGIKVGNMAVESAFALKQGAEEQKTTFQQGYYGDEYIDKILNPKLDREWAKSYDTQQWLITKYGLNWESKLKEALKLRSFGITDKKEIEKAIELKDTHPELEIEQVGVLFKEFKNISRNDLLNEKTKEHIERKAKKITKNNVQSQKMVMSLLYEKFGLTTATDLGNKSLEPEEDVNERPEENLEENQEENLDEREISREEYNKGRTKGRINERTKGRTNGRINGRTKKKENGKNKKNKHATRYTTNITAEQINKENKKLRDNTSPKRRIRMSK